MPMFSQCALHGLENPTLPPQGRRSLSEPVCPPIFPQFSSFVRMSAIITCIGQEVSVMVPSETASQMKWKYRLMCFVLTWNYPFLDRVMAA